MGNGTKIEAAIGMVKAKYPEVFSKDLFSGFVYTLEEYHKHITEAINLLSVSALNAELLSSDEFGLSEEADPNSEKEYTLLKSEILTALDDSAKTAGLSGVEEALRSLYDRYDLLYDDLPIVPQYIAPIGKLLSLFGLSEFVEAEIRIIINAARASGDKRVISIFEEEEEEDIEEDIEEDLIKKDREDLRGKILKLEEFSIGDPRLTRQPNPLEKRRVPIGPEQEGAAWGYNIYANMRYTNKAYLQNDDPRSFSNLLLASEKNILEFSSFFKKLGSKSLGYYIDDETKEAVYSKEYTDEILRGIHYHLEKVLLEPLAAKRFNYDSQKDFTNEDLRDYETIRQSTADSLDRFIASIKYRDDKIYGLLHSMGLSHKFPISNHDIYLSNHLRNQDSKVFKSFRSLIFEIIFLDVYTNAYSFRKTFQLEKYIKGGWDDKMDEMFSSAIDHNINIKISSFFDLSVVDANQNACMYFTSISRERIRESIVNYVQEKERDVLKYADCSVCGKDLYIRRSHTVFGEKADREVKRKSESYSEFKIDLYSLFTESGSPLTTEILSKNSETAEENIYNPPPFFRTSEEGAVDRVWGSEVQGERFSQGGMTWAQINEMVNAGNMTKHIEGLLRRSEALRQREATRLAQNKDISDIRFKCPYADKTGINKELLSSRQGRDRRVKVFECGYSPDLATLSGSSIIEGVRSGDMRSAKDTVITASDDIDAMLSRSVSGELIAPDDVSAIKALIEGRKAGGWRYSNTYFACPTIIDIDPSDDVEELYKTYNYIVSPLSGPVTGNAEEHLLDASEYIDGRSSLPSDGAGGLADLEPGTILYMACGSPASLSSFDVMKTMQLMSSLSPAEGRDLIDFLIKYGVESADLLPLIGAIRKVARLNREGVSERFGRIIDLLSTASGRRLDRHKAGHAKNLTLTCRHGHRFTVANSYNFGRSHCRFLPEKNQIKKIDGILKCRGNQNFEMAVDANIIKKVSERSKIRASYNVVENRDDINLGRLKFNNVEDSGEEYYFSETTMNTKHRAWGRYKKADEYGSIRSVGLDESSDLLELSFSIPTLMADSYTALDKTPGDNQLSDEPTVSVLMKLDRVATLVELLDSALNTCSNFLKMSSSLNLRAPLVGSKVYSLSKNSTDVDKVILSLSKDISSHILSQVPEKGVSIPPELSAESISQSALSLMKQDGESFYNSYIDSDVKFLSFLEDEFVIPFMRDVLIHIYIACQTSLSKQEDRGVLTFIRSLLFEGNYVNDDILTILKGNRDAVLKLLMGDSSHEAWLSVLSDYVIKNKGKAVKKIAKMRGQEYITRIMWASIAFHIAEQLHAIWRKFLSPDSNYNNVDIRILNNGDFLTLNTLDDVIAVCLSEGGIYLTYEPEGENNKLEDVLKFRDHCIARLSRISYQMGSASLDHRYQKMALEHIKQKLDVAIQSEDDSAEKDIAKKILDRVFTTTQATNINMGRSSKYVDYFSPTTSRTRKMGTMIVPSFGAVTCHPSDKNISFSSPIYAIFDRKFRYDVFDLPFEESDLANTPKDVIAGLSAEDISSIAEESAVLTSKLPADLLSAGWRMYFLKKNAITLGKGGKAGGKAIAHEDVSLVHHPYTITSNVDEQTVIKNDSLSFDTSLGFNIGPQGRREGEAVLFPPVSIGTNISGNIGVPIPIELSSESDKGVPLLAARLEISSGGHNFEMSDLMERSPKDESIKILTEIMAIYNDYKSHERRSMEQAKLREGEVYLASESAKRFELMAAALMEHEIAAKKDVKLLFSRYRGMPIAVARGKTGTKPSKGSIEIFEEVEGASGQSSAREMLIPTVGFYVPFVDSVIMGKILFSEAFSSEWAGHEVYTTTYDMSVKNAATKLVTDLYNLDYMAEKLNSKSGLSGSDKLYGKDLIDPYKLFDSESRPRLGKLLSVLMNKGDIDKGTGLRRRHGDGKNYIDSSAWDLANDLFAKSNSGFGKFYQPFSNTESPDENLSYFKVINTLFNKDLEQEERTKDIQDQESKVIMNTEDTYSHASFILEGVPISLSLHPSTTKHNPKIPITIGLGSMATAIKEYYEKKVGRIIKKQEALYAQRKKAGISGEFIKKSDLKNNVEIFKAANSDALIIMDEDLWSLWSSLIQN